MITDVGLNQISNAMGGLASIPTHISIGTGSSTVTSGDTSLLAEVERNAIGNIDTSTLKNVTYIADFSARQLSGLTIAELGLNNISSGAPLIEREVIGSIAFTGDRELQVQLTHRYGR